MKVLNLESGKPFSMGKGKNWSVLNPDAGADQITLNHAIHGAGHEFPQHIHDQSIDIILVLEGAVSLRQGEFYTPLAAGEAALIPSGEVHGTVNTSGSTARLISFQIPPDLALYRGERNKAEDQTPKPQPGTESMVEIMALEKGSPLFAPGVVVRNVFSPEKGSPRARLDFIRLENGQEYEYSGAGAESVFILLEGAAGLEDPGSPHDLTKHDLTKQDLSRYDVVFLTGSEKVTLRGRGTGADIIHCVAQP